MTELEQAKTMLAERRRADAERRAAAAHQNRVIFKRDFLAGRVQLLCECDYCIGEVLALRTPDRWECARLKEQEQAEKAKQSVTHAVVEPAFELKG